MRVQMRNQSRRLGIKEFLQLFLENLLSMLEVPPNSIRFVVLCLVSGADWRGPVEEHAVDVARK